VLVAVHLLAAAHIAHWLVTGRSVTPVEPSEAMAYARSGIVNAGLIFFAVAILATAIFGRWFCGWGCHLVALQDLCRWLLGRIGIRPKPLGSRVLAWVPAAAAIYMFAWPAAWRLWTTGSLAPRGSELTTEHFWATFPGLVVGLATFAVCGFACVYFLGAKGFCSYACPYGAIFAAADRVAPLRVRVSEACDHSGHCTAVCSSNVRVHEEVALFRMVTDPGCMKCGDCVSVCPNDALSFGWGAIPALAPEPAAQRPARRPALAGGEEAIAALAFAGAFFAFRGLYGEVPFLMSLGVAGIVAWGALAVARLLARPDFAWRHRALKRGGRLTGAGRFALGAAAAFALFWLHSGWLRLEAALADRDALRLGAKVEAALDVAAPPAGLDAEERAAVERARVRYGRLRRFGLLPWRGAAGREAQLAYVEGDLAGFHALAAVAVERGEEAGRVLRLEARALFEQGNLQGMRAAGERAIAAAPGDPKGYAALAVLLAQGGALAAAEEVLERGIGHFPRNADLFYDAGVVSAIQLRFEQALGSFDRALDLDPGHRKARENRAGMLAALGRWNEAVDEYRRALTEAPGDPDLRFLLARALVGGGRIEESLGELDRVLTAAPGHSEALALRASLRHAPGHDG
jgi:polyferredoxin/Tfp pilus assembly protein PilF